MNTSTRQMVRRLLLAASAVCVVLGAVAFGVILADSSPLPGQAELQAKPCSETFASGGVVTDSFADNGCKDEQGVLRNPIVKNCKDGRRYVQMGELIGFVGEKAYNFKNQPLLEPMIRLECAR